jgi:hypothetical protein
MEPIGRDEVAHRAECTDLIAERGRKRNGRRDELAPAGQRISAMRVGQGNPQTDATGPLATQISNGYGTEEISRRSGGGTGSAKVSRFLPD